MAIFAGVPAIAPRGVTEFPCGLPGRVAPAPPLPGWNASRGGWGAGRPGSASASRIASSLEQRRVVCIEARPSCCASVREQSPVIVAE